VPKVRPGEAVRTYRLLADAIGSGLVRSCHDLSEGGLAVAMAEMCFAGQFGVGMDLSEVPRTADADRDEILLFSETASRFLVEIEPDDEAGFRTAMEGVTISRIGDVNQTGFLLVRGLGGAIVLDEHIEELREAFVAPLRW